MPTSLNNVGTKSNIKQCENAYLILSNAHDAASSFLDIFNNVRKNRNAKGTPTDEEQDLLRAMLTFAGAGLDSMVKQLIVDALPLVVKRDVGAKEIFKKYIGKRLKKDDEIDHQLLADVLGEANPRDHLITIIVKDLTSNSLQSTDQLLRVGSYFNIPSNDICDNPKYLSVIFKARNEIAHEMDIDFSQTNRNRRPRARDKMIEYTNYVFNTAEIFLRAVEKKLQQRHLRIQRLISI